MSEAEKRLLAFRSDRKVSSKGSLSVVLQITRLAADKGLPMSKADLRTEKKGQVASLGRNRLKAILAAHGIQRILAEEAGRTSRGSLGLAEGYVDLLNELYAAGLLGGTPRQVASALLEVEKWWIDRVNDYFNAQHFQVILDPSNALVSVVDGVLKQARKRQEGMPGSTVEGSVLQHLVGANLARRFGDDNVAHSSASTADAANARGGDFDIFDSSIHVTTSPTERLMEKCKGNLDMGRRPIVIVPDDRVQAALQLAEAAGLGARVEIFSAQRFLSQTILELSGFDSRRLLSETAALFDTYNKIVLAREKDPSLQVDF